MERIKCREITKMVVDAVTDALQPNWEVDEENLDILMGYCDALDRCADEFNSESFNVDVDPVLHTISINMICDTSGIIIENANHEFCQLAVRSIDLGFAQTDEGKLVVEFKFPTLWELK